MNDFKWYIIFVIVMIVALTATAIHSDKLKNECKIESVKAGLSTERAVELCK